MSSPVPAEPTPADQSAQFFDALFGYAPSELVALLWTLQDKKSSWVKLADGTDAVAAKAQELAAAGNDVYAAVSVARFAGLPDTRIKSDNSQGLMGLWADIDIADPDVHKKWNLPPTIDAALELLDAAQAEPTLVIHSGHGLQAWWLFKEFWEFDNEQARLEAAGLAQRWNTTLQVRAAEKSWVVDSTFDLARVMRVPGTVNRKGQPHVPVRLLKADGPRYNPEDLEHYCVDASMLAQRGITPARAYVPDALDLSEAMSIDFERFQALQDNIELFEPTWNRKRKDFSDQSASSYDLSLATIAAGAGWSDREIAALIYEFRKKHKLEPQKALRVDYINRTLTRARDGLVRDEAAEAIDEVTETITVAKASGDQEQLKDARRGGLDVISGQLGLECLHVIKYMSDPPSFALVTPTHTIQCGGSDGILMQTKLRASIWESTGHQIERFKVPDWDRLTKLIPQVWEEQDIGAEATERGEVAAWLAAYLAQRPPVETAAEAATSEYPFMDGEGNTLLFGTALRRWLYLTYQERVNQKELGRRLRAFGCSPDKVNVPTPDGGRTSRGAWRLPASAVSGVA